jgi:hypothetical protein
MSRVQTYLINDLLYVVESYCMQMWCNCMKEKLVSYVIYIYIHVKMLYIVLFVNAYYHYYYLSVNVCTNADRKCRRQFVCYIEVAKFIKVIIMWDIWQHFLPPHTGQVCGRCTHSWGRWSSLQSVRSPLLHCFSRCAVTPEDTVPFLVLLLFLLLLLF